VAIIVHGEIKAEGPPAALAGGVTRVTVRLPEDVGPSELPAAAGQAIELADGRIELRADALLPALNVLTAWALERRLDLADLEVRRRNLEDVYLELNAAT
jgi:ABC-type multidrug transport system ATPase subunit